MKTQKIILLIIVLKSLILLNYQVDCACHPTCATCNVDNSATDCGTCDPALHRTTLSGTNTCPCDDGFTEPADVLTNAVCDACHPICKTCSGTSSSNCVTCQPTKHRSTNSATCPCDNGFIQRPDTFVDATCLACHYSCSLNCGPSDINYCNSCAVGSFRTLSSSNTCPCNDGYYDDGSSQTCPQCSHQCTTCQTSSTNCILCAGGSTRTTSPSCSCVTGMYDDGSSASCIDCQYTCESCNNLLSCSTCDASKNRVKNVITGFCSCMARFYDTGNSQQLCAACDPTCLTCSNSANTDCLSCNDASYRQLSGGKCICKSGYYQVDATTQLCQACHATCLTCSGSSSSQCLSCDSTKFRTTINANACPCDSGYYNNNDICISCDSSCLTCQNGYSCQTCAVSSQSINPITNLCSCPNTTIWNSGTSTCDACDTKCATCSIITTNCTSCSSTTNFRYLSGNNCLCLPKYYDNGVAVCVACSYTCMTCDSTGCLSCNILNKRTLSGTSCNCVNGYYNVNNVQACSGCPIKCQTCTSSTICTGCDSATKFRTLVSNNCDCIAGYFDSGLSYCQKCDQKCLTCTTNATNCVTCAGTVTTRIQTAPSCSCQPQYFDDGVSAQCTACHYSCKTCKNLTSCFICDYTKFRVMDLTTTLCKCDNRKYDSGTSSETCSSCDVTCLTCQAGTASDCLSCNSSAQRTYVSASKTCICVDGYYQVSASTQLCSACHITCMTCSGPANTQCQSCDATQNREPNGATFPTNCKCKDAYYISASFTCDSCHSSCLTCSNSSKCDTCPTSTQVNTITGRCQCTSTQAFDQGTTCTNCHYSCNTCSVLTTNCTTCDLATNFRVISQNTCICQIGYYDANTAICVQCSYQCLTCDANGCLTCNSNYHRTISSTSCSCDDGYYNSGTNPICLRCHYSCKTCTNSSQCFDCFPQNFRILDSTTKLCVCDTKYYEDQYDLTCKACFYFCASCVTSDRCQNNCDATKYRQFNTTTSLCQCLEGYYDNGSDELCQSCTFDCKTCLSVDQCQTCDSDTQFRTLQSSTGRCKCLSGYYQDTNTPTAICSSCPYSCQACTDQNTCSLCDDLANRVLDSNTNACLCKDGYYDDNSNQLCKKCHYSCKTCSAAGSCIDCQTSSFRVKDTTVTTCYCPDKYYDDGSSITCISCHYSCKTCSNTLSCTSCDATNFRDTDTITGYCKCLNSYYDDGNSNQLCVQCPYQCTTCANADSCLTCDTTLNFRYLPASKCICLDGYYNDGTDPICKQCQYFCQTCDSAASCLNCNPLRFRQLNVNTNLCDCMDGYLDTGINDQTCQPCYQTCLTCTSTIDHCTTCDATKFRVIDQVNNKCLCDSYYYDDLVNVLCKACHYSCQTCSDSDTCDSCDSAKHRVTDPTNDRCKCDQRYFDDGLNQMCVACHSSCLQCVDSSACTACDTSAKRLLNTTANYLNVVSPYCSCIYKHYPQANAQSVCLPCHYSCAGCSAGTQSDCLYCSADAHRSYNSTNKKCHCINGFYDSGTSTQTCQDCHPWCTKCTDSTNTACSQCISTHFLKIDVTTCFQTCPVRFFDDTSTMICSPCQTNCLNCLNSTNCTVCDTGTPLYKADCLASCPVESTFLNSSINTCIDCPAECLTCSNSTYCTSCISIGYYLDVYLHLCLQCHVLCKGCFGPAQSQCIDCNYPLYLNNSQCYNLSCAYGSYVDSHLGCVQCKTLFPNSLTCNISQATLCQKLYKLINGACVSCVNVPGYRISNSKQDCVQVCGDGVLYEFQCDDGNTVSGDGCSELCTIQYGWACTLDSNRKSVCNLDGSITLTVQKFFKYGGENAIKLYMKLSTPVRLNQRFFVLLISNLQNTNSYSWQFSQTQTDLSLVQFLIRYTQNIQGKQISLSYDTTRRRLLTSITLTFDTTFTISSYPPAIYYPEEQLSAMNATKNIIYVGCIILLCLCGLNLIFVRKMHIHIFVGACLPAQFCILYGLVLEEYTDWIKWTVRGLLPTAFIGGFKVGTYNDLPTTEYLGYSTQITKNTGIASTIILALWITYGLIIVIKRAFYLKNKNILKFMSYYRYFMITLQLCLLPHMTYSAVNALYNSSLTDSSNNSSPLNVCLAIVINIYLLSLLFSLFVVTKNMKPNQLIILSQSNSESYSNDDARSMQDNLSARSWDNRQRKQPKDKDNLNYQLDSQININTQDKVNMGSQRILNLNHQQPKINTIFDRDRFYKNIPPASKDQKLDKNKEKDKGLKNIEAEKGLKPNKNTSILVQQQDQQQQIINHSSALISHKKSKINPIQNLNEAQRQYYIDLSSNRQNQTHMGADSVRSQLGILAANKDRNMGKSLYVQKQVNDEFKGLYYGGHQHQISKNIEKRYLKQWLIHDYIQLYKTGGYKAYKDQLQQQQQLKIQKINKQRKYLSTLNQSLQQKQPTEPLIRKFNNSKYYLFFAVVRIYLTNLVASVAYSSPFVLFIIVTWVDVMFFVFVAVFRPFRYGFSNFRVIVLGLCSLALNGIMTYYAYNVRDKKVYDQNVEKAALYIMAASVLLSIVLLFIQTICAWRVEIWNKIQPCLISMRLRGARQVVQYNKPKPRFVFQNIKPKVQKVVQPDKEEQMDAFFSRMLKKESIQRQYRRERFLKNVYKAGGRGV